MKVLFMGCHCDDIELGCGGTIHKHRNDWESICVTFSNAGSHGWLRELEEMSKKALSELGASKIIHYDVPVNYFWRERQKVWTLMNSLEEEYKPDLVFTQCADQHQDHEAMYKEALRNFKRTDMIAYQSSIRNSFEHEWNWFEILQQDDVEAKLNILQLYPCYGEKIYFNRHNVEAQMRVAAMYVEAEFAEGFKLIKAIR